MKNINKVICIFIAIIMNISMVACNERDLILNEDLKNKTDKLIELGKQDNDLYVDFIYRYTEDPNIYETMYLLELSNIVGIDTSIGSTKQYILNESAKVDKNNLQELINIYKLFKYEGLNNNDNKRNIEALINNNKIIENLNKEIKLTDEVENLIFMLADINEILSDSDLNIIQDKLESFRDEILNNNENEKLYMLNAIDKLTKNPTYDNNDNKLKDNINSRVNSLMSSDYTYIWEIYNLVDFSTRNNICTKNDYNILINNSSAELFKGKNKLSNMKMLYLIKSYEILEPSLIGGFKNEIMENLKSCELISGGYMPQTDFTFPDDYSYLAIYLKKILNSPIEDETYKILYLNIINEIENNKPNWKNIYRFLTLVDKEDLKDGLIKAINKHGAEKLRDELSDENMIFYYLSMILLNNKIDSSKLDSFIYKIEDELKNIDNIDDIKILLKCYYYSELVDKLDRSNNEILVKNLSNILKKYKSPESNFYRINNYNNLLYTFLCIRIQENLNINEKKIDKKKLGDELKKYIFKDGGINMIASNDEFPSLYSTAVGIMLEELIFNNKEVYIIL